MNLEHELSQNKHQQDFFLCVRYLCSLLKSAGVLGYVEVETAAAHVVSECESEMEQQI